MDLPSAFRTETFDLARYGLWIQTTDDHEVESNWADHRSQADKEPD